MTGMKCVYCGQTDNLTAEHAPPKLIFPKPPPCNLITVPACLRCNREGSKDAEYFRLCLSLNEETSGSRSAKAAKEVALRGLNKPEAEGFRNYFGSGIAFADGRFSFEVDTKRIFLVVEQTVKCLYLHENGKRIPDTHEVIALSDDYLSQFDAPWIRKFQRDFVEPLCKLDPKVIGKDCFAYAHIHTAKEFVSVWGILFYGSVPFVALTGTRKRPPQ